MNASLRSRPLAGFTLVEVLVAIALLAVVSAVLVPAVMSQVRKGEQRRLAEDLRSLSTATTTYFSDVGRWPGSLEQLGRRVTEDDRDVFGSAYTAGLVSRWKGPYLGRRDVENGLATGYAGRVSPTLGQATWNDLTYLRIAVGGVEREDARRVSLEIDGDTLVGNDGTGDANGAVRWVDAGADSLIYFMRAIER